MCRELCKVPYIWYHKDNQIDKYGNAIVKSSRARSIIASVVCSLSVVLSSASVFAVTSKTTTPAVNSATNTLKISPVRSDVVVPAGTSKQVPVEVFNTTSTTVALQAIENDFVSKDEKGTPAVILDENSYAPTHSLKRFMVPLQNVTIPPNSSSIVNVTITVPKSAQAGGYFGALRFAPAAPDGSKQVNLGASVVSLILLTVPGPTVEQLLLTDFNIQQDGGSASNFRTPTNLSLLLRFQNKGNVQEAPNGLVYVQKGKKVLYSYKFNQEDPKDDVLPDSARRWDVPLKGFGKFGKYTVGATLGYGNKGQSIEISKTIWIIPTTYIIAAIGSILGLVLIVTLIYVFLRSYKRKILRSSRRRY